MRIIIAFNDLYFTLCSYVNKNKKKYKQIHFPYLAGLKFSFNESDSKFPDIGVFLILKADENAWRSSESLWMELLPAPYKVPCMPLLSTPTLLLLWGIWSAWLLELSSVGSGAQAIEN